MRSRQRATCLTCLLTFLILAAIPALVHGQGGTGKMPMPAPPLRMPPPPPMRRSPPPRTDLPPEKRKVNADIYVVPTTSGSLSINDRLPEELGKYRRQRFEANVDDYTNRDHGAVEVLRAEYDKEVLIFLSRFQDANAANKTMQTFAKNVANSHTTVSRKHLKNRSGQTLGEFLLLKVSGTEKDTYLLATNGSYLYRVYGKNPEDVQRVFRSLPLK